MKNTRRFFAALIASIFAIMSVTAEEIMSENLHLQGSKGKLFGILQYPGQVKDDVKYPLIIICHGFTGNCQAPLEETLSKDIIADGMAALRFDFNGHGKSEGEFKDMTVPNEIEDLKCVIAWAQKQPWVESIALTGHSQGGVVVSMTAGDLGDSIIKAEVLMAPAAVLRDDAIRGNTMGARYNPWNLEAEYVELLATPGKQPLQLGKNYIESAMTLPIYETARKYEGPALILQGTHDFIVPYTYSERYNHELPQSELMLIDGDDHGFTATMKETCKFVADWLKTVLKPAPTDPVKI